MMPSYLIFYWAKTALFSVDKANGSEKVVCVTVEYNDKWFSI